MKVLFFCCLFIAFQLQAQNPHKNILVGTSNKPNEPTIAVHPKDPNILLAGSNIDNLYRSNDGGKTWTEHTLRSTYGVWGDPVIIPDTAGNFYFFHLSNTPGGNWIDRIVCQKSTDNGTSWTNGSYMGLNGAKAQDKHWAIVDPRTNYIYVTWTQFDKYGSKLPEDKSSIMFAMSKDEGETWTAAKKINEVDGDCIDSDNTTEGAVPTIGPNSELYVAWAGPKGLVFDRSLDGGKTWLEQDIAIDPMPGGWNYEIPGIYRCNGLPVTTCDIGENSPYKGTIYINWTDQRNGADDTDVWLAKSTDQGNTWSKPIRVNNDKAGNQQFLSWMTVDPTNGYLYFVFYDRRESGEKNPTATDVYMARSTDGGKTFVNFKISDKPFYPNPSIFFGDYTNVIAKGDMIRPIWCELNNDLLSVKTAIVDQSSIPRPASLSDKVTPTPVTPVTPTPPLTNDANTTAKPNTLYIAFKLHQKSKLTLHVFDEKGKRQKPIFRCKRFEMGKHIEQINLPSLNRKTGNYTYQLKQKKTVIKEGKFEVQ